MCLISVNLSTCMLMVGGHVVFSVALLPKQNKVSSPRVKAYLWQSQLTSAALLLSQSPCTGQSVCSACLLIVTVL